MWKTLVNSEIAKSVQESLEKTGETITKQAQTMAKLPQQTQANVSQDPAGTQGKVGQVGVGDKLKQGWGNFIHASKQTIQEAQRVVEKEQIRLAARLNDPNRPRRRDPSLPLDVDALRDADVVYITDRILTLSHPAMQSTVDGDITPARKLAAIGQLLHKRHGGRYMVWNLSEVEYDVSILDDQVLLFSFPGSPSPPLGLLLKLLISMESWLKADERNVAVVHCLTGKGRTSTVVAAFLCWTGEAGFRDVHQALNYIASCKRCPVEELTIPSQRRYIQYFANMLDGVRPSQPPLMLKRIILSEAPRFAKGPPRDNLPPPPDDSGADYNTDHLIMGCAPYLQIFKAGQLVFTTAASMHFNQGKEELPFCQVADGTISFHIENVVQGDILIRCRHLTAQGQRVSMFRAAFHTGYSPPNVMRLTKAQLDGACSDKRFPDDFFMDLIFEPCDAETASKHLSGKADAAASADEAMNNVESQNEASERRSRGTMAGAENAQDTPTKVSDNQGATVTASAYDSMLHRDSRFWDVIAARRQEHANQAQDEKDAVDPFWGITIGRRRQFATSPKKQGVDSGQPLIAAKTAAAASALSSFSIGGEFDFMSLEEKSAPLNAPATLATKTEPKRDELMDALNAIDDDEATSPIAAKKARPVTTEEILFVTPDDASQDVSSQKLFKDDTELKVSAPTPAPPMSGSKADAASNSVGDATPTATLMEDTNGDFDDDMDAFLESAGVGGNDDDDDNNADIGDLDFDDDELDDLENFLTSK